MTTLESIGPLSDLTTFNCNGSCSNTTEVPEISGKNIYDDVLLGLQYIDIFLLPTCLILGVGGNFITLVVLNNKAFLNWTSKYFLVALSLSDNLLLLTQPLNKPVVMNLFGRDYRALSNLGCKLYFWFFKNGKMTSSWFVVLLCAERFVAVKYPFKVKLLFCKRNCLIAIASVYIVQGVYNGVWSWAHNILEDGRCYPDGFDKNDPEATILFRNMLIAGCCLYSFVPIAIMVTLTPMIISSLKTRAKKRQKMTRSQGKDIEIIRITTMLLSIVITYIVCVAPVTVLHMLSFFQGVKSFGNNPKPFLIFRNVSQMLEQLNYTINFFVYVVANRRFRGGVVELFGLKKSSRSGSRSGSTSGILKGRVSTISKPHRSITSDYASSSSIKKSFDNSE
ncbi:unnamed protein product [Mytilus coruscus]|uniref:G-protein coupled receptors family 1 profile domain-containing protein n=1 Tax=Mytilus coruscus TaxID=42192 RepID=A0A6J8B4R4_MYTCO|nr:unnamed protein product [Mytilus coruscus]